MTFEKANEAIQDSDPRDWEGGIKAFGCEYFHNICIKCRRKPQCYRKEPLIKKCNFYDEGKQT